MRYKHSEYMYWAKTQSRARFNLATSGVGAFPLGELGKLPPLEINGETSYGYEPLKQAIASKCCVDADCVVSAEGTSMANYLAFATLLDPGDEAWLEEPGYAGARGALIASGARVLPAPIDEDGIRVDLMTRARRRARLVYVTPSHQFPLGVPMSLARRFALLRPSA